MALPKLPKTFRIPLKICIKSDIKYALQFFKETGTISKKNRQNLFNKSFFLIWTRIWTLCIVETKYFRTRVHKKKIIHIFFKGNLFIDKNNKKNSVLLRNIATIKYYKLNDKIIRRNS